MIVIGVDVHKQAVTAVAVDEAGRILDEKTVLVGSDQLVGWAAALGDQRLWAVEDCRQLTRWLERQLLALGEELVRVPPKLTLPERRAGRARGKSEPSDALAIARAALRGPDLARPRPRGADLRRDQASGRPSRRSRRGMPPCAAAVALAPLPARPRPSRCRCGCLPARSLGACQPLARPPGPGAPSAPCARTGCTRPCAHARDRRPRP